MYVQRNNEARSYNHCCSGTAISITYSEFVVVGLGIQQTGRMRKFGITGLSGSTVLTTLTHKRQDFRKKIIDHKMCVLIFYTVLVCNITHSKKN